jgi:hypothetical protein
MHRISCLCGNSLILNSNIPDEIAGVVRLSILVFGMMQEVMCRYASRATCGFTSPQFSQKGGGGKSKASLYYHAATPYL